MAPWAITEARYGSVGHPEFVEKLRVSFFGGPGLVPNDGTAVRVDDDAVFHTEGRASPSSQRIFPSQTWMQARASDGAGGSAVVCTIDRAGHHEGDRKDGCVVVRKDLGTVFGTGPGAPNNETRNFSRNSGWPTEP